MRTHIDVIATTEPVLEGTGCVAPSIYLLFPFEAGGHLEECVRTTAAAPGISGCYITCVNHSLDGSMTLVF